MRRSALKSFTILAAASMLVALSACSGGGDPDASTPADDSAPQEISPEQWMTDNCTQVVAEVDASSTSSENAPAFALLAGPASAPQMTSHDEQIRVYTYDETADEMTPVRVAEPGEQFCFDSTLETMDAEYAQVFSSEFPEGAWVDSVPKAIALDESGQQIDSQDGVKEEYRWTTEAVDPDALSEATETVEYCEVMVCV
ncbi:hypothetical protein [Agrococcus casei]|nr:hypothetical protein [Agrococcus casei]